MKYVAKIKENNISKEKNIIYIYVYTCIYFNKLKNV